MTRFTGKVAFVTGAAGGIGRATALAFARERASVGVADIAADGVEETARLIEQAGGQALAVTCDVSLDGMDLFWSLAHVHGGPAPVRRFLPELIDLIWNREINPGKVFDLQLPLDEAADAYRAMDERDAIKVLLRP